MKLSIITVNLNNHDGLAKTVNSVICQTFTDFEWIIVDGGSSDGSRQLIESHSDRLAWWVSKPDKGIYNAMNKGVAHAKGDYLLFLNSGDYLNDKNVLQKVFSFGFSEDILYGDSTYEKQGVATLTRVKEDNISLHSLVYIGLFHQSTFIRRQLLIDCPYSEDYRVLSDTDFFLKQYMADKSFRHLDLVVSRFDATGLSSTNPQLVEKEIHMVRTSLLPPYVLRELAFTHEFVDGQMSEVRRLRDKGILFKKMVSFNVICMRIVEKCLKIFKIHNSKFKIHS